MSDESPGEVLTSFNDFDSINASMGSRTRCYYAIGLLVVQRRGVRALASKKFVGDGDKTYHRQTARDANIPIANSTTKHGLPCSY
jgi:hypothetical protein